MPACDTHKSTWQGQWHCIINKMDFYFNLTKRDGFESVCRLLTEVAPVASSC